MENPQAQQLIKIILSDLDHVGIITNTLVENLKKLRTYAVNEKQPVVAKALRLCYEHIEKYNGFNIPIPEDEPIEGEDFNSKEFDAAESVSYLIQLVKNINHRLNRQELRWFNTSMENYIENH